MKSTITFLSLFLFASFYANTAHGGLSAATGDTTLNKHAPDFSLKDLDGKTVTLSDYKGKVLILDFWATWCEPCRMSFPIIKMVIDKYKDDPNVKFLFIDTQESAVDYIDQVKTFLRENNYTFHVALDKKRADGKMGLTSKDYAMPGIPAEYVIDINGMIRFQNIGFNTLKTGEMLASELSQMIETAKVKL